MDGTCNRLWGMINLYFNPENGSDMVIRIVGTQTTPLHVTVTQKTMNSDINIDLKEKGYKDVKERNTIQRYDESRLHDWIHVA